MSDKEAEMEVDQTPSSEEAMEADEQPAAETEVKLRKSFIWHFSQTSSFSRQSNGIPWTKFTTRTAEYT